jgi:hypothetical protein
VICVAPALLRLPLNYSLAIILHELGHLKLGVNRGTECDADRAGAHLARVSIQRRTYGKQRRLEFLPAKDVARARAAVLRLTDLEVTDVATHAPPSGASIPPRRPSRPR